MGHEKLPKVGERIIVYGLTEYHSFVKNVEWYAKDHDHLIILDWGGHGTSRVWARDKDKVWYPWILNN